MAVNFSYHDLKTFCSGSVTTIRTIIVVKDRKGHIFSRDKGLIEIMFPDSLKMELRILIKKNFIKTADLLTFSWADQKRC